MQKKQIFEYCSVENLKREIKIQRKLVYPHIVKLHHYFEDKENVYLILEYAGNYPIYIKREWIIVQLFKKKKKVTRVGGFCLFFLNLFRHRLSAQEQYFTSRFEGFSFSKKIKARKFTIG